MYCAPPPKKKTNKILGHGPPMAPPARVTSALTTRCFCDTQVSRPRHYWRHCHAHATRTMIHSHSGSCVRCARNQQTRRSVKERKYSCSLTALVNFRQLSVGLRRSVPSDQVMCSLTWHRRAPCRYVRAYWYIVLLIVVMYFNFANYSNRKAEFFFEAHSRWGWYYFTEAYRKGWIDT